MEDKKIKEKEEHNKPNALKLLSNINMASLVLDAKTSIVKASDKLHEIVK